MASKTIIRKIGKEFQINLPVWFGIFWTGMVFQLSISNAQPAGVNFTAEVDTHSVSMGDPVVLVLSVKSEGSGFLPEPTFEASDFDVFNRSSGVSIGSQYDSSSGQMSTVTEKTIKVLLQPRKVGKLKITHIQLGSGNQVIQAPDIQIAVESGGGRRRQAPSQRLSPGRNQQAGSKIVIKAEVDRPNAFKGEKVIVSYYLYHQPKVFNVQIDKFPTLAGFLREDLDSLAMGQSLETEDVRLNGESFQRSLLARYAAYPLQEGDLEVDSVAAKFNYILSHSRGGMGLSDEDDPFLGFFHQMAPQIGEGKSEPLQIHVKALPEVGKPSSFAGGVGKFDVVSMVDKYEVRANEAVTLTLKIEGTGNITTIQEPKGKWPANVELYDSKGRTLPSRGGLGAKIFEFLLIPRESGNLTLPPLEMSFFDPDRKEYYKKSTDPIQIKVLEGAPGSAPVSKKVKVDSLAGSAQSKGVEAHNLMSPDLLQGLPHSLPIWRILYNLFAVLLTLFIGLISWDVFRGKLNLFRAQAKRKSVLDSKKWAQLQSLKSDSIQNASWKELTEFYEALTGVLHDALDEAFLISSRSVGRAELKEDLLGTRGVSKDLWEQLLSLFDFADLVRFASSSGAISESKARNDLIQQLQEAGSVIRQLLAFRRKNS